MTHETFEALATKAGNPRIAPQDLPAARISPVTVESGAADYGLSSSVLELVSHVRVHGDQAARVEVEQYLGEVVLAWLLCHPNREAACNFEGKEHYVSLTFERFWQVVVQRQDTCETLAEVLACLRASLQGAILETLRDSSRPGAVSSPHRDVEDRPNRSEIWDRLQALLPHRREQRLAYLLYHCGLRPREITRFCPQEWSDVHEVARLRRIILEQLMKD